MCGDSFTMNRARQVVAASVLLGAVFLPTNADAATAFQIHSDPTCTNGLSLTNVKMVCTDEDTGGSSTCVFGDSAHVSGTLSIPDSGLFGKSMTSKACLYGAYPCRELQTNGDFCETFGLSEYGCPTTGEYSIEKSFDLPGDQGLSLGSGWYFVVTSTIVNDDGTTYTCKVRIDAVSASSKNSSSAFLLGFSCVVLAGISTAFVLRRRRLRARIDLLSEERSDNFELMRDGAVRV